MAPALQITLVALIFLLLKPTCCSSSNILVVPVDGSHWVNMKVILQELHSRGHNITVLRSSKSWYIPSTSTFYTAVNVSMLEDESDKNFYSKMLQDVFECRNLLTFIRTLRQQHLLMKKLARGNKIMARAAALMLDDPVFIKKMQDVHFDLMLTDPALNLGVLLGSYLKLPMVYNVRWINVGEGHFSIAPSPVSYVPVPGSELNDNMGFQDRIKNMLHYLYNAVTLHFIINPYYSDLLQRHFPPGTDLLSLQQRADIWLIRTDFVFEFPRPTMPNVVYIGGFQAQRAKHLPTELEDFMQSSGDHGVVVMSLGTFVHGLPRDTTEAIAAAFAELPQKVVWRFTGERPSSLGNNTLLVDWMPQNDLLGHPKTRAFVAHGGTNGMYEAIYHGVPVLGLPLLFDQFDNVERLKVRGAARMLEAGFLKKENFLEALKDVLSNPSYRRNIQLLSQLHRNRPMSPMDTAIFWIEYVIRNKGAAHLQSVGSTLPWYIYYSLDVALVLMTIIVAFMWTAVFTCRLICCRRFSRKMKEE
uniref:UDP-glucuronosyltransferase n=1 Tax=Cynoglossus semilaevis TaxID=244447 RepID=A0A3P8W2H5_CYNSE